MNECGFYQRLNLPVSYELYISKRQLMNNSDTVHMVEMATPQPCSAGWTSECLKVLFWSFSRKRNYYLNRAQPFWVYKSNVLWTGFLVTLLTLPGFRQVENALSRILELVCSNFYFIGNYLFTYILEEFTIFMSCCAGTQGMQTSFDRWRFIWLVGLKSCAM